MTYTPISDADLAQVSAQTTRRDETEPRIAAARSEAETGRLFLEMTGGAMVVVSARSLRGLGEASDENPAQVEGVSNGSALHWDELDVQFSTLALLQMIFKLGMGKMMVLEGVERAGTWPAPTNWSNANS